VDYYQRMTITTKVAPPRSARIPMMITTTSTRRHGK